ncbi:MAG TPA: restriction endonuclease [Burkholderiaceae bacterium]|nr:restriction endonuclease [Burkholderiaceae bacterium]
MQTILFLMLMSAIAFAGWSLGAKRWRTYNEALNEREQAKAAEFAAMRRQAQSVDKTTPTPSPAKPAATGTAPLQQATAQSVHQEPPATHDRDTAPVSLDANGLKTLRGSRFARLCVAYFELTGLKARRHAGKEPIDALLFAGNAATPMMALRWARSSEHPAGSREVIEFGLARKQLNIQHATFIAQHGATLNATKAAAEQAITLITADQLATKISALPDERKRLLLTASQA